MESAIARQLCFSLRWLNVIREAICVPVFEIYYKYLNLFDFMDFAQILARRKFARSAQNITECKKYAALKA
jgi:hypothetical protein